jgi:hypothetical protein
MWVVDAPLIPAMSATAMVAVAAVGSGVIVAAAVVWIASRALRPLLNYQRDLAVYNKPGTESPQRIVTTIRNDGLGPARVVHWRYRLRRRGDDTIHTFENINELTRYLAAVADLVDDRDYTLTHLSPTAVLLAGSREQIASLPPEIVPRLDIFQVEVITKDVVLGLWRTKIVDLIPSQATQRLAVAARAGASA